MAGQSAWRLETTHSLTVVGAHALRSANAFSAAASSHGPMSLKQAGKPSRNRGRPVRPFHAVAGRCGEAQWSSPETAGLAHDSVRAVGTGAPRCSSNAASLWSNSRPTLVIWGVLKLPNWVLG